MVQAMIDIPEEINHVLNIVKAKFQLKDKSEAIVRVVLEYGEELLEPELKTEFIQEMIKRKKEPVIKIRDIESFKKRYGL